MGGLANDLRNGSFFGQWVQKLPDEERELFLHAAIEYLPLDDTLRMIFTADMRARLESKGTCERLMDHIRAFYDVARQSWIRSGRSRRDGVAPQHVVMPRVELQVAPTIKAAH
jgi:hypothetical protein